MRLTRGEATALLTCDLPVSAEPAVWWPDLGTEMETTRIVVHCSQEDLLTPIVTELNW